MKNATGNICVHVPLRVLRHSPDVLCPRKPKSCVFLSVGLCPEGHRHELPQRNKSLPVDKFKKTKQKQSSVSLCVPWVRNMLLQDMTCPRKYQVSLQEVNSDCLLIQQIMQFKMFWIFLHDWNKCLMIVKNVNQIMNSSLWISLI